MPKINQEEYEVLKEAQEEGYKWIVRNYNGALIIYTSKPMKNPNLYWDGFGERMDDRLFQSIRWEDESPYNIAELIEEYEKDYKGSWEHAIEFSGEVFGESEETEVKKDIEWLKEEIQRLPVKYYGFSILKDKDEYMVDKDEVIRLINQLVPKQEEKNGELYRKFVEIVQMSPVSANELLDTLSNLVAKQHAYGTEKQIEITEEQVMEWLDNNEFYCHATAETVLANAVDKGELGYYGTNYSVVEKPVIPKFVAEWIERYRDHESNVWHLLNNVSIQKDCKLELWSWLRSENNVDVLARAWLDGYTVEEEQKYYVLSKDRKTILLERWASGISPCAMPISEKEEGDMLTEQEIKDYDERYWAFAVKVEELEE